MGTQASVVKSVGQPTRTPRWYTAAACRHHPLVSWFPERKEDAAAPRAICARCSVQADCLREALADSRLVGIWGGTDEDERRRIRRGERARVPIERESSTSS